MGTRVTVNLNCAYHSILVNEYSYCGREFQDESETSCCRKKKFFQNKWGRVKFTGDQFKEAPILAKLWNMGAKKRLTTVTWPLDWVSSRNFSKLSRPATEGWDVSLGTTFLSLLSFSSQKPHERKRSFSWSLLFPQQ